ncbi:MAG: hypothetical protein PHO63_01280 [Bacilli bacterium]|nr:hypothetical protein [Bacilli bacterium]MDD4809323.1 hypothetical protein [Bacilli bacterium]
MSLTKSELLLIEGGLSVSGTLINSFVRGINVFLDLGRSVGTAIRRIQGNKLCPF